MTADSRFEWNNLNPVDCACALHVGAPQHPHRSQLGFEPVARNQAFIVFLEFDFERPMIYFRQQIVNLLSASRERIMGLGIGDWIQTRRVQEIDEYDGAGFVEVAHQGAVGHVLDLGPNGTVLVHFEHSGVTTTCFEEDLIRLCDYSGTVAT